MIDTQVQESHACNQTEIKEEPEEYEEASDGFVVSSLNMLDVSHQRRYTDEEVVGLFPAYLTLRLASTLINDSNLLISNEIDSHEYVLLHPVFLPLVNAFSILHSRAYRLIKQWLIDAFTFLYIHAILWNR